MMKYDIGKTVKVEFTGEIIAYSAKKDDDCYTIDISAPDIHGDTRIYISGEMLEACIKGVE